MSPVRPTQRPRVKICGVTTVDDALFAVRCGAELLGLNFHRPSPRFVEIDRAAEIARAVREQAPAVQLVAVVVNRSDDEIRAIDDVVGLDLIQFHGDEPDEQVNRWGQRAIRALRSGASTSPEQVAAHGDLFGVLVDAPHGRLYGGTGEAWEFSALEGLEDRGGVRLLLAGGIGPDNAVDAWRAVPSLWALDLCSGIESRPGHKDLTRVRQLFERLDAAAASDSAASTIDSPAVGREPTAERSVS